MSKAFTSESDDEEFVAEPAPLPPGIRNYVTPVGMKKLDDEITRLSAERKSFASLIPAPTRLASIERRLRFLNQRRDSAQVIDPTTQARDKVLFGARVTIEDSAHEKMTWTIVGVDEADPEKGLLSWMSPLATALLEARVGETRAFLKNRFTVLAIDYTAHENR